MFKYAVFDIKPTYNHIIPDVQLHSMKMSFLAWEWGAQRGQS